MQTKLTLTIDHARPIPELCDLVAGRAYTLSHVEGVEAAIVTDKPFGYFRPEPFGWTDCAENEEGATALYEAPVQPVEHCLWARNGNAACPHTKPSDRFSELNALVVKWASDRQIVQNSNVLAQAKKSLEEVGELVEAAAGLVLLRRLIPGQTGASLAWLKVSDEYKDAIGDVLVTLLVGCATAGIDPLDCLQLAYDEIKDRKGTLRADGVFVKEA